MHFHLILVAATMLGAPANSNLFQPARMTCKQVISCEEAVEIWCNGYGRADGDSDGIPCETVCHSLEQVDEIRNRLGC